MNSFRLIIALVLLMAMSSARPSYANDIKAPLVSGQAATGNITGTGVDTYTFKTKKGGSFVITVSSNDPHNDKFTPQMEISGPENIYEVGIVPEPHSFARKLESKVPEGDWTVKVTGGMSDGDSAVSGAYELTLLQVPGAVGKKLKFGQQYKNDIHGGVLDVYTFSGTPGVTVEINTDITGDKSFFSSTMIFDPAGVTISDEGAAIGSIGSNLTMTAYGDYTLMIGSQDSGNAQGGYTLSINRHEEGASEQEASTQSSAPASPPSPPAATAPPTPPIPPAMTVAQVFDNPAAYTIYSRHVFPMAFNPTMYTSGGLLLTLNPDDLGNTQDRKMVRQGNLLALLYTGDSEFRMSKRRAVNDYWIKAADNGNTDARNRLGILYSMMNDDQAQNYPAADWYKRAVEQGKLDRPVKISNLYHGTEHPQDDAEIVKLATGYAEKGVPEAQYVLGVAYEAGQGVQQDYEMAENWYRKAASQNNRNAEYALGKLYVNGHGMPLPLQASNPLPPDPYYEGVRWFKKAANHGLAQAQFQHALMFLYGDGENIDFSMARASFQSAAQQGLAPAQFNIALMCATGLGGDTDYACAAKWYERAAAQGLILAQNNLGELFEHGAGVTQDYEIAAKWYRAAAETGYPVAQYNLGRLYRDGRGVSKDTSQAMSLFAKSAAEGNVEALAELDELKAAAGNPQARGEEITVLRAASANGDNDALLKLVTLYRSEGIMADDYDDVLALYRKAAEQVNPIAFVALGDLFAKKEPPDYAEAYFWYRLAIVSIDKWRIFSDEKEDLTKYAEDIAARISGNLMPEQVAVAQWRIADRSPPAPDKEQLAGAELYIKGNVAEQKGDYYRAMEYYMEADSDDVALAAEDLGRFFEHGLGVNRNMERAIYYFKRAVRNGRIGTATWIGDIYLYGIGVPVDINEAAKWYQMDADRGCVRAIQTLGWIYLFGGKGEEAKAIELYEKMAARDSRFNADAYDPLGMIYLYGIGVSKDPKKALSWYQKAGDLPGQIQAAWILTKFEPHDYGQALERLSHAEDPVMYNDVGYLYERGLASGRNNLIPSELTPTAMDFYQIAANMCYGRAMYHMARLYQSGVNDPTISEKPIPKDHDKALKWMKMAAHYGSVTAVEWLYDEDKSDPNPKASLEPEVHFPVTACKHLEELK
ncbi:MAG TPA: hypothetical protein VL625_03775 [Patescibacteria group bacterium]|nr:hypothetical protein [Patescibacteria group bacterium]